MNNINLGLIILAEHEEIGLSEEEADRAFFYIAGVASLTLLLNATMANFVLQKLGLLDDSNIPGARMTVNQVSHRLRTEVLTEIENSVRRQHTNTGIHWSDLIQYNTLLQKHDQDVVPTKEEAAQALQEVNELIPETDYMSDETEAEHKAHERWKSAIKHEVKTLQLKKLRQQEVIRSQYIAERQILAYCRSMFLSLLRVEYWELISSGKLPRNNAFSTQVLLYSVDIALDHAIESNLHDWPYVRSQSIFSSQYNASYFYKILIQYIGRYLPASLLKYLQHLGAQELYLQVQILLNFIEAQENAQMKYETFLRPNGSCGVGIDKQINIVMKESQESVHYILLIVLLIGGDYQCMLGEGRKGDDSSNGSYRCCNYRNNAGWSIFVTSAIRVDRQYDQRGFY